MTSRSALQYTNLWFNSDLLNSDHANFFPENPLKWQQVSKFSPIENWCAILFITVILSLINYTDCINSLILINYNCVLAYTNIINIKGSLKYLFSTWYWLLKYFAMASINTIPPVVDGRSESLGRIGVVNTTASVLAERLARRIPYTFCPGIFCN